jgi:Na+-driven multidrug efflux pump
MTPPSSSNSAGSNSAGSKRTGARTVLIGVVLAGIALLAVGIVVAVAVSEIGEVQMSAAGWAAMLLGIVLTLGLGFGLMSLVFISNRRGYDERGDHRR